MKRRNLHNRWWRKSLLFLIHSRPGSVARLCETLNATFVFLPRSANAGRASQRCLGSFLPYTAKKFIYEIEKLLKKEEKQVETFGLALHRFNSPLLRDLSLGNAPCPGLAVPVCSRFGRCIPRTWSCSRLGSNPAPSSAPACASGQRSSRWKKGTIPVLRSALSSERSSSGISDQPESANFSALSLSA